jgi:tRNA(Ile2)-agmatinylcytidine synthase
MFIAADDTDSSTWMCTTFLATELVRALPHLDLIGLPRLVRLNPAVPWKTRGNAAICLRVGKGRGQPRTVGRIGKRDVRCYARSVGEPDQAEVLERCVRVMEEWSQLDDSDPGLVVIPQAPRPDLYQRAVTRIITKEEARQALQEAGGASFELNAGRGIIGATAAAAWVPEDRTYEVLTYRERERWGKSREVSADDVSRLDRDFPATFNNYEIGACRPAIIPHTTCPVLYGVRGDSAMELIRAKDSIRSEPVDRWLLFISNQGTDDHVIREWSALEPNSSYDIPGEVAAIPVTVPGGHVIFSLRTTAGDVDCAAYEPSKEFRQVVRALRPGDHVRAIGELRESPRTLNLEKLMVVSLARSMMKAANPRCPECGKGMKSIGKGQGYRCRDCGTKALEAVMEEEPRTLRPGWYEPPVCARRHLSKPLKRMDLTSMVVV